MENLKVNTDGVVAAANTLRSLNSRIQIDFSRVQSSVKQLCSFWEGSAASNSTNKFNEISSTLSDARYKVVDNYVNFLCQQIADGYVQTEDINKSLADAFK